MVSSTKKIYYIERNVEQLYLLNPESANMRFTYYIHPISTVVTTFLLKFYWARQTLKHNLNPNIE